MTTKPPAAEKHGERPQAHIPIPYAQVAEFCRRNRIRWLALFGSVLSDDFGPDSDVDVLVRFEPDAPWDLWDIPTMQEELRAMFGREVDLVDKDAVEQSQNPFRRRGILRNARVVYARE